MDEPLFGLDREVQLIPGNGQQQQVPGAPLIPAYTAEMLLDAALQLAAMVAAQAVIVTGEARREPKGSKAEPEAVQPLPRLVPLRPEPGADQRLGLVGVNPCHGQAPG